jgi:hypothetical protein
MTKSKIGFEMKRFESSPDITLMQGQGHSVGSSNRPDILLLFRAITVLHRNTILKNA